ncbi:ladderlectin-like [Sitodiplosis mosellana]|uniref:ladderlectin-like n=1 Tax=Sitodiplosis mosellana TaxID=263140 RepID=UPI002445251C|nr:ladderlectin-like [Sitodiplosis mosellana]
MGLRQHRIQKDYYLYTKPNYHIVPYLKSNWLLANMYCNKIGMRLISISTMEEHDAILKAIQNVGLSGAIFWTTGRRVDHTMYWFATGTKLNFTNWGQNEPFNRHTMQECIGIQEYDKLTWIDVNCDYNLRIMCEEDRP